MVSLFKRGISQCNRDSHPKNINNSLELAPKAGDNDRSGRNQLRLSACGGPQADRRIKNQKIIFEVGKK
jgi:hypothetical protein